MKHVRAETSALNSAQFFLLLKPKSFWHPTRNLALMGWYVTVPGFTLDFPGGSNFQFLPPANQSRTQNTKQKPRSMAGGNHWRLASSAPKLSAVFLVPPRHRLLFRQVTPPRQSRSRRTRSFGEAIEARHVAVAARSPCRSVVAAATLSWSGFLVATATSSAHHVPRFPARRVTNQHKTSPN